MNGQKRTVSWAMGAPAWLLDASLFTTAVLLGEPLLNPLLGEVTAMREAVLLPLGVHILVSVYDGRFSRWRTATWIALLAIWTLSALEGFLGYVLPWGQMQFWLAARLIPLFGADPFVPGGHGSMIGTLWSGLGVLVAYAVLPTMITDVAALHAARVSRWRPLTLASFVFGTVVAALALHQIGRLLFPPAPVSASAIGGLTASQIIPSMDIAWAYAILRAVPGKLWAVATTFAFMLLPIIWPWARAWRFHAVSTRRAWAVLCLGLLISWLGLTYLGMQPPSETNIVWSRCLALYDFAFFLILPFLLARSMPSPPDRRAKLFE